MTAVSATTIAAANRKTESIVRLLRRPGSVAVSRAVIQAARPASATSGSLSRDSP